MVLGQLDYLADGNGAPLVAQREAAHGRQLLMVLLWGAAFVSAAYVCIGVHAGSGCPVVRAQTVAEQQ